MNNSSKINENVEHGDLARLVDSQMSVDEFRSKMGEDKDIVVVGFTVMSKDPAKDLVNFIEKSYDWVLDADISSGETTNGNYMVFVELQRTTKAAKEIYNMMEDLMNLTSQELDEWEFSYFNETKKMPLTLENLTKKIIGSPEEYEIKTANDLAESAALNHLRSIAGITVQPSKIKDVQILDLQIAAGIR